MRRLNCIAGARPDSFPRLEIKKTEVPTQNPSSKMSLINIKNTASYDLENCVVAGLTVEIYASDSVWIEEELLLKNQQTEANGIFGKRPKIPQNKLLDYSLS